MAFPRMICTAAAALFLSLPAAAADVEVWLTHEQLNASSPFPDDVSVYVVDEADQLQAALFAPVTQAATEAKARQAALRIFHSPDWPQKELHLKQALQTLTLAQERGIKKTPAIVFGGARIVYGTTRIDEARSLDREAREQRAKGKAQ